MKEQQSIKVRSLASESGWKLAVKIQDLLTIRLSELISVSYSVVFNPLTKQNEYSAIIIYKDDI